MNYKKILDEVREKSYPEIKGKIFLIKMKLLPAWAAFLWLIPGIRIIAINPKHCDKLNKKENEALIAHELAHGIQGKETGYFLFWLRMIPYFLRKRIHKRLEVEADIIAIDRGYFEGMKRLIKKIEKDPRAKNHPIMKELEKYKK